MLGLQNAVDAIVTAATGPWPGEARPTSPCSEEEGERELASPRVYHLCDAGVISTRRVVVVRRDDRFDVRASIPQMAGRFGIAIGMQITLIGL